MWSFYSFFWFNLYIYYLYLLSYYFQLLDSFSYYIYIKVAFSCNVARSSLFTRRNYSNYFYLRFCYYYRSFFYFSIFLNRSSYYFILFYSYSLWEFISACMCSLNVLIYCFNYSAAAYLLLSYSNLLYSYFLLSYYYCYLANISFFLAFYSASGSRMKGASIEGLVLFVVTVTGLLLLVILLLLVFVLVPKLVLFDVGWLFVFVLLTVLTIGELVELVLVFVFALKLGIFFALLLVGVVNWVSWGGL